MEGKRRAAGGWVSLHLLVIGFLIIFLAGTIMIGIGQKL